MAGFIPDNAVVWAEFPVTDMDRAKAFYGAVVGNTLKEDNTGPNPMANFVAGSQSAVAGHLYPGKPAAPGTGPTIHLAVAAPVEEAMERVTANGGQVLTPVIAIPAGRFAYCVDPDGNSFGVFSS